MLISSDNNVPAGRNNPPLEERVAHNPWSRQHRRSEKKTLDFKLPVGIARHAQRCLRLWLTSAMACSCKLYFKKFSS